MNGEGVSLGILSGARSRAVDGTSEPRGNLSMEIRGGTAVQRTSLEGGAHGDLSRRSLREMRKDPWSAWRHGD